MTDAARERWDDWDALIARPRTAEEVKVVNPATDNGAAHAYTVDVANLECECEFAKHKGNSGPKVCKHVAKAVTVIEPVMTKVVQQRQAGDTETPAGSNSGGSSGGGSSGSGGNVSESSQTPETPAERARAAAQEQDLMAHDDPNAEDGVAIWEHDEYGSLQIERLGYLEDREFEALKDFTSHPQVSYDESNDRNFVPSDQIEDFLSEVE